MLGAIIGDIVGSIYEFDNIKSKEFNLFDERMAVTDDSILTIATADWLLHGGDACRYYADYARKYPNPMGGYGASFNVWAVKAARTGVAKPYNSCGNGSAMRVSPVAWVCNTREEVLEKAKQSAECTHNHPEGIKGAQATALGIFMAVHGDSKQKIKEVIENDFGYDLSMPVDEIRMRYSWDGIDGKGNGGICQDSVPQAITCAIEAQDFEDAIRNAVSIGGDSDTIACIAGSLAEAIYGIPKNIYDKGLTYLPERLKSIVKAFEGKYGCFVLSD